MKTKIGIFGGTFDPFTISHREIVKEVLETKLVDYVYICPTIVTWHRENYKPWLDDKAKVYVIEQMISDLNGKDRVFIDEDDLRLRQICKDDDKLNELYVTRHRFIDTLLRLKVDNDNDDEFYPIIGSDELKKFDTWAAYKSILKLSAGLIVVVDEDYLDRDGTGPVSIPPSLMNEKLIKLPIRREFRTISASKMRESFCSYENYIAYAKEQLKKINAPKVICHTPIFDVVKGNKTKTGLEPILVNAPDWVTIIVENSDTKTILTEKQFRYGTGCDVNEFPCGMVEKGEAPLDAAVRELKEETGIELKFKSDLIEIGSTSPNPAFMTNMMHYFYIDLAQAEHTIGDRHLDEHEQIEVRWRGTEEFINEIVINARHGGDDVPAIALAAIQLLEFHKEGSKRVQELLN